MKALASVALLLISLVSYAQKDTLHLKNSKIIGLNMGGGFGGVQGFIGNIELHGGKFLNEHWYLGGNVNFERNANSIDERLLNPQPGTILPLSFSNNTVGLTINPRYYFGSSSLRTYLGAGLSYHYWMYRSNQQTPWSSFNENIISTHLEAGFQKFFGENDKIYFGTNYQVAKSILSWKSPFDTKMSGLKHNLTFGIGIRF